MLHHRGIHIEHTYWILAMPVCTQLRDSIWDAEQSFCLMETGFQLQAGTSSFHSSPSHFIGTLPRMIYVLVWGSGKQTWIIGLHCTGWVVRTSSWSGKSTSGNGQASWSAMYAGGCASGGCSQYREYVETRWILGAMRVQHWLHWCWQCWSINICCDPAGDVCCQQGYNVQIHCLNNCAKNGHPTHDDVCCYTQGSQQAMRLRLVWNGWSCHLNTEHWNIHSRCWNYV